MAMAPYDTQLEDQLKKKTAIPMVGSLPGGDMSAQPVASQPLTDALSNVVGSAPASPSTQPAAAPVAATPLPTNLPSLPPAGSLPGGDMSYQPASPPIPAVGAMAPGTTPVTNTPPGNLIPDAPPLMPPVDATTQPAGAPAPATPLPRLTPPDQASDIGGSIPGGELGQIAPPGTPVAPDPAQTPAPVSSAPTLPGVDATTYGPGNDLLSTQINPTATDRGAIAQSYLDAFDTRAAPQIRDQIRAVGQRAASLGRLGMGDTAVETLNPYTDYLKERAALASQLAGQSAEGQIADEANARAELRGERDYQTGRSDKAITDAINQWIMQQQERDKEFQRGTELGQLGYGNSPSNLLFGAGQQYGNNSNQAFNAFSQWLSSLG
jgi:hypothetical protein